MDQRSSPVDNLLYFLFGFQPIAKHPRVERRGRMFVKSKITIVRQVVKRYSVLLEFRIVLGILPGCAWSVPTACVIPLRGTAGKNKARKRKIAKVQNKHPKNAVRTQNYQQLKTAQNLKLLNRFFFLRPFLIFLRFSS